MPVTLEKNPWYKREYALYKGDNFITIGTIMEISIETGKSIDFLRWMTYPTYEKRSRNGKKRLKLVLIEDDEEEIIVSLNEEKKKDTSKGVFQ